MEAKMQSLPMNGSSQIHSLHFFQIVKDQPFSGFRLQVTDYSLISAPPPRRANWTETCNL